MSEEYPSFEQLSEFTGVNIDDLIDPNCPPEELVFRLADLLPHYQNDDKLLHGYYQIIFYCLENGHYRTASDFYNDMTTPDIGGDGLSIGDHTDAFIHYCLHLRRPAALAYVLGNQMYDPNVPIPIQAIQKVFGMSDLNFEKLSDSLVIPSGATE